MSIAFLITSLLVVATPGTGVLYTVSAGLARGRRAGIIAAFGCTLGILPHLVATVTGLAAVLHASAPALQVIRFLGVAYLLYLAWATLRSRDATLVAADDLAPRSAANAVVSAILINVLNPKLTIFFLSFLPQFIDDASPSPLVATMVHGGVFMLLTFAVFALYGAFAAAARDRLIARPWVMIWLRRSFAASFVGLGVTLALTH